MKTRLNTLRSKDQARLSIRSRMRTSCTSLLQAVILFCAIPMNDHSSEERQDLRLAPVRAILGTQKPMLFLCMALSLTGIKGHIVGMLG